MCWTHAPTPWGSRPLCYNQGHLGPGSLSELLQVTLQCLGRARPPVISHTYMTRTVTSPKRSLPFNQYLCFQIRWPHDDFTVMMNHTRLLPVLMVPKWSRGGRHCSDISLPSSVPTPAPPRRKQEPFSTAHANLFVWTKPCYPSLPSVSSFFLCIQSSPILLFGNKPPENSLPTLPIIFISFVELLSCLKIVLNAFMNCLQVY